MMFQFKTVEFDNVNYKFNDFYFKTRGLCW